MQRKSSTSVLKYASVAVISSVLTYSCSHAISYGINTIKFCNATSEKGFVPKGQAFSSRIIHEKNSNGSLETYLQLDDIKYEIFARDNGLILGDAFHNWSNFSDEEKKDVLASELYNADQEKLGLLLSNDVYIHLLSNMPQEKRIELFNELAKSLNSNELTAVLSSIDSKLLWDSIPNETKKEMLMENLNASTKKTVNEIKNLMRGFWGEYYGH